MQGSKQWLNMKNQLKKYFVLVKIVWANKIKSSGLSGNPFAYQPGLQTGITERKKFTALLDYKLRSATQIFVISSTESISLLRIFSSIVCTALTSPKMGDRLSSKISIIGCGNN